MRRSQETGQFIRIYEETACCLNCRNTLVRGHWKGKDQLKCLECKIKMDTQRILLNKRGHLLRGILKNNRSGYRGVHRAKDGRWVAQIGVSGKSVYLGRYLTPEKAAEVYNNAAIDAFGVNAFQNKL